MELFGGLMIFFWIAGLFLTIIWFILPFIIISIKGRVEEVLARLDIIDSRLSSIETRLNNSSPE